MQFEQLSLECFHGLDRIANVLYALPQLWVLVTHLSFLQKKKKKKGSRARTTPIVKCTGQFIYAINEYNEGKGSPVRVRC